MRKEAGHEERQCTHDEKIAIPQSSSSETTPGIFTGENLIGDPGWNGVGASQRHKRSGDNRAGGKDRFRKLLGQKAEFGARRVWEPREEALLRSRRQGLAVGLQGALWGSVGTARKSQNLCQLSMPGPGAVDGGGTIRNRPTGSKHKDHISSPPRPHPESQPSHHTRVWVWS